MPITSYSLVTTKVRPMPFVRLVLLCLLISCAAKYVLGADEEDEIVNIKQLSIERSTGLRLLGDEPFSGEAVQYYANGNMATLAVFLHGKRHGLLKKWFDSGLVSFDSNYAGGRLNGLTKSWWSNGVLRSETRYLDGKTHGKSQQWYASGEKFKKMNYESGHEVGLQQAWRKNGKLFSNYEYVNGRVFGLKRSNMCFGLKDEKISINGA